MENDRYDVIIHDTDSPAVKTQAQQDEIDHERVQFTALSLDYNENSQTISVSCSNSNSMSSGSSVNLTKEEIKQD